jgi:UDP:flavonoid glycosyltransferase YjiC (YdhE family)
MSNPFVGAVRKPPLLPDGQSTDPMNILYYLTAHGYGHAVRTSTICNELSRNVRLIFRTTIPENFFREEVKRPFEYLPGQFDCGCIQSDSVTVDKKETLQTYMTLAEQNLARLEEEVRFCREQRIDGIVSDITPLAFEVARKAGLPSVAVANFTWLDIYAPYVREFPSFAPFLEKIRQQYQMADLLLELMPSMEMPYFANRVRIPPVAKQGRNRSGRLKEHLGLEKDLRIALIYVGELGMEEIRWGDLGKVRGWHFLGIYPLPGSSANYHLMDKKTFPYEDLVASAELMVTKIGYGVVSQALINGTPLIYLPREDFAEFPVLEKAIQEWGHGYRLSKEDYYTLKWERVLEEVSKRARPKPVPSEGGRICARQIENLIRRSNPQKFLGK